MYAVVAGIARALIIAVGVRISVVPALVVALTGPVGVGVDRGEAAAGCRAGAIDRVIVHLKWEQCTTFQNIESHAQISIQAAPAVIFE